MPRASLSRPVWTYFYCTFVANIVCAIAINDTTIRRHVQSETGRHRRAHHSRVRRGRARVPFRVPCERTAATVHSSRGSAVHPAGVANIAGTAANQHHNDRAATARMSAGATSYTFGRPGPAAAAARVLVPQGNIIIRC